MKKTVKHTKYTGIRSVCWREFKVQKKDGTLHKHGHGGRNGEPYQESYKPASSPKTVRTDIVPNADTSSQIRDNLSNSQQSQDRAASQDRDIKGQPRNIDHPP